MEGMILVERRTFLGSCVPMSQNLTKERKKNSRTIFEVTPTMHSSYIMCSAKKGNLSRLEQLCIGISFSL